jgi:WD40 repeat protein
MLSVGIGLLWCVVGLLASPAFAAFPGRNGLLAVQPVSGAGIVLVAPDGRARERICTTRRLCGIPDRPRWSPDGRALVFASPTIKIVYPDGSCMNCQFGAAASPAFEPSGTVISFIEGRSVQLDGIDGLRQRRPPPGLADDAVWAATGRLAVVRKAWIWAGTPGRLARLGAGTEPSWSPDGSQVAAASGGWIVLFRVSNHRVRRLVRGSAPAFSPDGRWIAYFGANNRLMVIRAAGRRARPVAVGRVRGLSVDWQPEPTQANPGCVVPSGSRVLASSSTAVVTADGPSPRPSPFSFGSTFVFPSSGEPTAYMGCLRSDGRERLLEALPRLSDLSATYGRVVGGAVVAAPYAALVLDSSDHYGGQGSTVQVFDLRTGAQRTRLGGESFGCGGAGVGGCGSDFAGLRDLVLGSDGVSAADFLTIDPVGFLSLGLVSVACVPTGSQCLAVDASNHLLGSIDPSAGAAAWSRTSLIPATFGPQSVACPSASLCVAVGGATIYTSSDPVSGLWTSTSLPGASLDLGHLTCPSSTMCVASSFDGTIAGSTDPTAGAGAWSIARLRPTPYGFYAPLCPSTSQCWVTGYDGTVFASNDPAGGANAWTVSPTTPAFSSGSCPTSSLCVALSPGDSGTPDAIFTTTHPGAGSWTTTPVPETLASVACPSASLCVAVGSPGVLEFSTSPATGPWNRSTIDSGRVLTSIACPSISLCVAADSTGHVVTSTDPTGGPGAWTTALIDGDACSDITPCSVEQLQASDGSGVRTVDASEFPGTGPFLTGLRISGDVLSWSHSGMPRSVTLIP